MEVFSRPLSPNIPAGRRERRGESYPVLAPEQVQRLFRQHLSEICSRLDSFAQPVSVVGTIGEVPADHWRRRETTPLLDRRTATVLLLDIPPSLLEGDGLHAGESVRVWGVLRARLRQGQVVPRFEVFSIRRDGDEAMRQQVEAVRQMLCQTPPQRRDFPSRAKARMLLLGVGVGEARLASLQPLLGGFWQESDITLRALRVEEQESLMASLAGMDQDILFLVLGEGVLAGLDSNGLMQGLLRCPAYRVLACERQNDGPASADDMAGLMMAHMAERFFETPAEAAGHIRQKTAELRQKQDEDQARQEELSALRSSLAALTARSDRSHQPPLLLVLLAGAILGGGLCLAGWWIGHALM